MDTEGRTGVANDSAMQVRIVAVGRVREGYIAAACADFTARLAPYFPVEIVEVRASSDQRVEDALGEEGERILKAIGPEDRFWLLDRGGKQLSSLELSRAIDDVAHAGVRRLTVAVAGTFGAAESVRRRADFVWSLSKLTLLHEWARALLLEQLYRAAKIARNEPYHH